MKKRTDKAKDMPTDGEKLPNDNLETQQVTETPELKYSAENSELDAMLDEATTTVEEKTRQDREEQAAQSEKMSAETAAEMAVTGLMGVIGLINDNTDNEIVIPEQSVMMFAGLTAPLIMKYGSKINLNPETVNLDSWMPEIMALGGAAVVAYPMYKQMNEKVIDNGDKSERGA